MRATTHGVVLYTKNYPKDFNFSLYVREKYEGLIPENFPSSITFRDLYQDLDQARSIGDSDSQASIEREITKQRKLVHTITKEWMKQQ